MTDEAVEKTLTQLRERGAKFEPVEDRGVADNDTVVLDIERSDPEGKPDRHENVSLELGAAANPPGFDAELIGLRTGDQKTFTTHFPEDYAVKEMANTDVQYSVTVKDVRRKVLPELDDEFAKDLGRVRVARRAARPRASRPAAGVRRTRDASTCAPIS